MTSVTQFMAGSESTMAAGSLDWRSHWGQEVRNLGRRMRVGSWGVGRLPSWLSQDLQLVCGQLTAVTATGSPVPHLLQDPFGLAVPWPRTTCDNLGLTPGSPL